MSSEISFVRMMLDLATFKAAIRDLVTGLIVDLNYEASEAGENFDYKEDLKSPLKVKDLEQKLSRSYEKDVARGKASSFKSLWERGKSA